jgi:hypothetical protein
MAAAVNDWPPHDEPKAPDALGSIDSTPGSEPATVQLAEPSSWPQDGVSTIPREPVQTPESPALQTVFETSLPLFVFVRTTWPPMAVAPTVTFAGYVLPTVSPAVAIALAGASASAPSVNPIRPASRRMADFV